MNYRAGFGICVDTARFVPTNVFFKHSDITQVRTVNCYELVIFLRDGGYAVINDKKYPITAGSVRFHRPGDKVYSYRFNEIYVLHFNVDDEEKGKKAFEQIPSFIRFPNSDNEMISIFDKIIAALLEENDFECMLYFWELFAKIQEQTRLQLKSNKNQTVFQIKKYIDDNFSEQLTLAEIASEFHIHPIYMQRKFKKETGMTPAEYIKNVRLQKARAYLLTTDLNIDEISELCGFCNASYFISVFKNSENLTPFQYRQKINLPDKYL